MLSQHAETAGPEIERRIREDLGIDSPISYKIESGPAKLTSASSFLIDSWKYPTEGSSGVLFTLHFDLTPIVSGQASLEVTVNKHGATGVYIAPLIYRANLSKSINGNVYLELSGSPSKADFYGDPEASTKLNAIKDLAHRAFRFTKTGPKRVGWRHTIKIEGFFGIVTQKSVSQLQVVRLPNSFGGAFEVRQFFEIANLIESSL